MKTKNKETDNYNRERLVDINLILQYMESLDVTKEYFTELGEGHLRGLASVKDEIKFINIDLYNKILHTFRPRKKLAVILSDEKFGKSLILKT